MKLRLGSVEEPETFQSLDLFRYHGAFANLVARLLEAEYQKLSLTQAEIDRRTSELARVTLGFAWAAVILALVFAVVTVRLVSQLIARLEWQTAELGRVSWHMLEDQEATARRFSHELHDELGQALTAVKTNLTAIQPATQTTRSRPPKNTAASRTPSGRQVCGSKGSETTGMDVGHQDPPGPDGPQLVHHPVGAGARDHRPDRHPPLPMKR